MSKTLTLIHYSDLVACSFNLENFSNVLSEENTNTNISKEKIFAGSFWYFGIKYMKPKSDQRPCRR